MIKKQVLKNRLWYKQPSKNWVDALPIGNGRLAGMVCGKVFTERIHLNEDTIWSGGPQERDNKDALSNLPEVRRLISDGKIKEAEWLASLTLTGTPDGQRHYQPLGDLFIFFRDQKKQVEEYSRELDLEDGVARVQYKNGGDQYKREIFCSYPDQVIVVRLTSNKPEGMSFMTQLSRGALQLPWKCTNEWINSDSPIEESGMWHPISYQGFCDGMEVLSPEMLMMKGSIGSEDAIRYRCALKAVAQDGIVHVLGDHLLVENTHAVTLIIGASTSFRSEKPEVECRSIVEKAAEKSYEELLSNHTADYKNLYKRVSLEIGDSEVNEKMDKLPTDARIINIREGNIDDGLVSLCFQYGRYLLISSSRPGSLPSNLQGKWASELLPMWDSKYTNNINIQMNYWPSEICNLSECHEPLFDFFERMREPGRKTARIMYGCKGFVAHHNSDLWADTAPQDIFIPATFWPMGSGWFCLHLWEHYAFTGDEEFLKKAYETMKEAAEFYIDFMIEDKNGDLVTSPSISPENSYLLPDGTPVSLGMGSALDMEIIRELFDNLIKSSEILGEDLQFREKILNVREKLLKPKVGKFGQIQEWYGDYPEKIVGHHHLSPIFSLYPGQWFTPQIDAKYAKAAKVTLERRTNNWSKFQAWPSAWAISLWSRLKEGDKACEVLNEFMKNSLHFNLFNVLFNMDYAFQIDGNFGLTAGVSEMLLQSHANEICLLPALPKAWIIGKVTGLRARGGMEVDIYWEEGHLKHATIKSLLGNECRLRIYEDVCITCEGKVILNIKANDGILAFSTEKNKSYIITVI